jgi:hypothetical protein
MLGIIATPLFVDFGNVPIGSSAEPQIVTVSNTGTTDIHIGTIDVSGPSASEFIIQNDQASQQTLTPAQNRTFEVVFTPFTTGLRTALVEIPSDDPNIPLLTVDLRGSGLSPPIWFDTFSDGDASDWLVTKGTWTVVNDELSGTYHKKADILAPFVGCQFCLIEADLRVDTPGGGASLLAWRASKTDLVEIRMMEDKDQWLLIVKANGKKVARAKTNRPIFPGINYRVATRFNGASIQVFVDNELILNVNTSPVFGTVGFRVKSTTLNPVTIISSEIFAYPY